MSFLIVHRFFILVKKNKSVMITESRNFSFLYYKHSSKYLCITDAVKEKARQKLKCEGKAKKEVSNHLDSGKTFTVSRGELPALSLRWRSRMHWFWLHISIYWQWSEKRGCFIHSKNWPFTFIPYFKLRNYMIYSIELLKHIIELRLTILNIIIITVIILRCIFFHYHYDCTIQI